VIATAVSVSTCTDAVSTVGMESRADNGNPETERVQKHAKEVRLEQEVRLLQAHISRQLRRQQPPSEQTLQRGLQQREGGQQRELGLSYEEQLRYQQGLRQRLRRAVLGPLSTASNGAARLHAEPLPVSLTIHSDTASGLAHLGTIHREHHAWYPYMRATQRYTVASQSKLGPVARLVANGGHQVSTAEDFRRIRARAPRANKASYSRNFAAAAVRSRPAAPRGAAVLGTATSTATRQQLRPPNQPQKHLAATSITGQRNMIHGRACNLGLLPRTTLPIAPGARHDKRS
jgi:hypothetical protein